MRAGRLLLALLCGLLVGGPARAEGGARTALRLLEEERLDEAEALRPSFEKEPSSETMLFKGQLEFLQGRYRTAAETLAGAEGAGSARLRDEAIEIRKLAEAADQVTQGFSEKKSAHFVVRYAPGRDEVLGDVALEALERAYLRIGSDLGERPTSPVRVEIYGRVSDLARVSPLSEKEIETSGTIALCKFNRLMIVSPRALLLGYPWLDTLTHEYTHFVISRASHNRVPVWLQEGLAKFEERRWRSEPGGGLSPTMEHLLAHALEGDHLIPFSAMYPSIAKLSSQEEAALAFAEVYMAVDYLYSKVGYPGLRGMLGRMRDGADDRAAVGGVLGVSFADFEADLHRWLVGRKLKIRPGLLPQRLRFRKADSKKAGTAEEDDSQSISEEHARRYARLGGMLRARHHLKAAAIEYEKARSLVGHPDPQLANKLARTYLELGAPALDRAVEAAKPAAALYPDEAGPNAVLGEAYLKKGLLSEAQPYLEAALRVSPFDPLVRCGLEHVYAAGHDPREAREAAACRLLSNR